MQTKAHFISVLKIAAAFVILLAAFNPASHGGVRAATVWHVPADYTTLQAALDAAISGDTILVAPGTYVENIDFNRKDVILQSVAGAERTFIHPAPGQQTITVTMGPRGRIQGFNISNGDDDNLNVMFANFGGSLIQGNIFENNHLYNGSSIINVTDGSPTIAENIFRNNACNDDGPGVVDLGSNTKLVNNLFINNDCPAVRVFVPSDSSPEIINNTFVGNTVAIFDSGMAPEDGRIYRNNLIYKNFIGIRLFNEMNPYLPTWENNLVYGNSYNFGYFPNPTGTNGNISADPLLIPDSTPPYRLQPGSPAIDAGSTSLCPAGDFRGIPRPQGSGCDIGAFEFSQFTFTRTDFPVIEEDGTALVSVALNASLAAQATIQYATTYAGHEGEAVPGEDYTPVNGTLTFPAGVRQASFSIPIIDEDIAEDGETISLALSNAAGTMDAATVTILKNDWHYAYLPQCVRGCFDFFDDFSNSASGWKVSEDSQVKSAYVDGEFEVDTKSDYMELFLSPACEHENYIVELDAHWMADRGSYYGIIFGVQGDMDSFYVFGVYAADQKFYLDSHVNNGPFNTLIPRTKSSFIHVGKQVNHLKVTRSGSSIIVYINGKKVGRADDDKITGITRFGLFSAPAGNHPISEARFDNYKVTTIWDSAQSAGDFMSPLDGTFSIPDPALSVDPGGQ